MRLINAINSDGSIDLTISGCLNQSKVAETILRELKLEELYQCVEALRNIAALSTSHMAVVTATKALAALEKGKV